MVASVGSLVTVMSREQKASHGRHVVSFDHDHATVTVRERFRITDDRGGRTMRDLDEQTNERSTRRRPL